MDTVAEHTNKGNGRAHSQAARGNGHANDRHGYCLENLPHALTNVPHWGVWKREYQNGKTQNVPFDASTGEHLSNTEPATWSPYKVARDVYLRGVRGQWDGLSFVLSAEGGIVGLDIDDCVDEHGELTPDAQEIVNLWGSYLEYSPSRRGIRGFAYGTLPEGRRKVGNLEIYDSAKALTVTGWPIDGMPHTLEERPEAIREIHTKFFTKPTKHHAKGTFTPDEYEPLTDDDVIEIALRAKNGARVQALMEGDFSGYASHSEADLAACNYLAFYCGPDSHEQIDRIFRAQFAGFRPDKWDKRHYATGETYGQHTVKVALEDRTEFYRRQDNIPPSANEQGLPEILITTKLTDMVDAAEHALRQLPGPTLFQRARMLCQIAPAGPSPAWIQRSPNSPIIAPMHITGLREYGARSATWKRYDKRAKTWSAALPPTMIFETLAARVQWRFPHLEGIVDSPTLRPDGTLLATPGYDSATGLFLNFPATAFPAVHEHPSRDDAVAALRTLYEPFADFPFATPASQSAAIAATMTVVVRYAICGCTPLFACRAHSKGSGKGLLINTIAMIGTGRVAPTWTQAFDEAEESKRLLTVAMEGDPVAHIDNVTRPLGNAPLDSAITATSVKGRLLGRNVSQEAPWTTVIFASGNNMTLTSDMARRVVPIDLDPQCEHPEERSDFQHSPLLEWVHRERPRLVVAALTVLKAFFHAGCPKQPGIPEFGSFEQWSNLIRHALVWCGWPDPNEGRKNLEAESDTSYEALATLLQCWGDCYPDGVPHTLKAIIDDCALRRIADPVEINPANKWNALWDALASYDAKYDGKRIDTKRLGNALKTIEGRVLDGQRIIRRGETHRVALWKREILK